MLYEEEIREKLGSENVDLVLDKIRRGNLLQDDLKAMARKMHPYVYGDLVHNLDHRPDYLFQNILDSWYNQCLCKKTDEEARREFNNIVQNVNNNR